MSDPAPSRSSAFAAVRPEWLSLAEEDVLEPHLPLIDCHHHLWSRPECPYEAADLWADVAAGHRVAATVFVECRSHYLPDGERSRRSLGETQYVTAAAEALSNGAASAPRPLAGIVGYVDLQLAASLLHPLLQEHVAAARGRLRGIRNLSATMMPARLDIPSLEPSLLMSSAFREGFAQLRDFDLSFDAWMFHTQLGDLVSLARAFPDTTIVLNHLGGPTGVGARAENAAAALHLWTEQVQRVAECPNVVIKVGGLGMPHCGFGFHERPLPPSSAELCDTWQPLVERCINAFGVDRCLFESNFPVDKTSYPYVSLWNAFKRLTHSYSASERRRLLYDNAARIYRLEDALDSGLRPDAAAAA